MLSSEASENMLVCLARVAKPMAAAQQRLARSASRNMLSSKRVKNGGKGYALIVRKCDMEFVEGSRSAATAAVLSWNQKKPLTR